MPETKDLILKSGEDSDWEAMYRNFWSHADVFRYLFAHSSDSAEAARKRTAAYVKMQREAETEFFVYEKSGGQPIGIAGIKQIGPGIFTVTDIAIGPAFMGHGYGKQILTALIELAFEGLGANELHYNCFKENEISRRLALSCGFAYSHTEDAELRKNGKWVRLEYYKLCRERGQT